jgi:hypothetical protein
MSTDVFKLAEKESKAPGMVGDSTLNRISQLATQQLELQRAVKVTELELDELKKKLERIEQHDLPEAMDEVGMSEFKLKDGTKITISSFYNASIPAERREEAYTWLDDHEHGGIIKTDVSLNFGRGELEIAKEFVTWLNEQRPELSPELSQNVHWQTLRAFVREMVESGAALPLDLFGVFIGRKAKLTITAK